jgi:hypothetical protein
MSVNPITLPPAAPDCAESSQATGTDRAARRKFVAWWLLIGLIAAGACSLKWPSVHLADEYLPFGMDAFYHARRILDTAADPAAFYEFDSKIHAPEGSLLPWPWGYDYAMAMVVRAAGAIGISGPPIAILIWLPVVAVFLSVGLMMLIARRLGLSAGLTVIAGLAMALSPLTQHLHGVGQLDHHFAEYIFVLATILCGLRWFSRPHDPRAAVVLGAVLGAAPAIHNGLFILQLPVLVTLVVLWLQNIRVPLRTTVAFSTTLLVTTLAILLPSLPFRLGHFEFYTLSWFHLYVAAGSAAASLALAALPKSNRNLAVLGLMAAVLLIPLAQQIVTAGAFLAGTITRLETISEMRSPIRMARSPGGRQELTLFYSLLLWLAPLAMLYCAWRGWQERATARVFFWLCCISGLMLLATQLRLHYFGSFALYLPWLIVAEGLANRLPSRRTLITLSATLALVLAYWMPGRYQLTAVSEPAADPSFRVLRPVLDTLHDACAEEPGIVLADNDAGHYIRYYTECAVIANNFLLTRQHEDKIRQIDYLTSLTAEALPAAAPYVRYVLLRPVGIPEPSEQGLQYMSYSQTSAQLIQDLLLQPPEKVPARYVLLDQVTMRVKGADATMPYLRLYKVQRQ